MRLLPANFLCAAALAGCAANSSPSGSAGIAPPPGGPPDTSAAATRAIVEADIIQLADGKLYAMSKAGSVSIVDVATPGKLALLGQTQIAGEPFEMYRRGTSLLAMTNASDGATLVSLDVSDAAHIQALATRAVPGEIADSRLVGDVLYLVTYEDAACLGCGPAPRTLVTSFDVRSANEVVQVDQASFESNAPDSYNLPWGMHWKRSILATPTRLYVGGHADIDPAGTAEVDEGIVDVLDITDPNGRLGAGARLAVAGAILSRWQFDEQDGILRVISQRGAGRTGNGLAMPVIQTFRIADTQTFVPLGRTTMQLPMQEGLRSVRFDGARAYAITYNQTDPLFVLDLSDAANPRQRGELFMPGFMYYLEPHGDRVIGLGIDRTDAGGSLNVSLFDVSDADHPTMLARAPFATPYISEDFAILNSELAEDQDRIQKAFHVFDDGLVVVPFNALRRMSDPAACDNTGGGVQVVRWTGDTLSPVSLLPVPGHPRRAFENLGQLVAVSDSNVREFSLAVAQNVQPTADLVIDTCVPDSSDYSGYAGGYNGYGADEGVDGHYQGYGACSVGHGGAGGGGLIALGLAGALRRRRRAG